MTDRQGGSKRVQVLTWDSKFDVKRNVGDASRMNLVSQSECILFVFYLFYLFSKNSKLCCVAGANSLVSMQQHIDSLVLKLAKQNFDPKSLAQLSIPTKQ